MKYALWMAALLLAMVQQQPALAQGSGDSLVKQAVAAEGGADALRGVKAWPSKAMQSSGSRGSLSLPTVRRALWEMRRSP